MSKLFSYKIHENDDNGMSGISQSLQKSCNQNLKAAETSPPFGFSVTDWHWF